VRATTRPGAAACAGLLFVLVSLIFYAPATILFVMTRRERGRGRVFSPGELVMFLFVCAGAVAGIVALWTGWVEL
jgi:arginine:ornithine antiporter/lysine permease